MILCTNPVLTRLWDRLLRFYPDTSDDAAISGMPRRRRIFYLIYWMDCEVQNGGVGQWILHQGGNYYIDTIDALIAIGAIRTAAWLVYIQDALGCTLAKDWETRKEQVSNIEMEQFDEIAESALSRVRREFGEWEQNEDEENYLRSLVWKSYFKQPSREVLRRGSA